MLRSWEQRTELGGWAAEPPPARVPNYGQGSAGFGMRIVVQFLTLASPHHIHFGQTHAL